MAAEVLRIALTQTNPHGGALRAHAAPTRRARGDRRHPMTDGFMELAS
jgi:hypothetical protein